MINLHKEHFRISEIIYDIINSYTNNADNKNIKFECLSTEDDLTIYADKNSIDRVISNLISNSIKFIPYKEGKVRECGVISIKIERRGITNDKDNKGRKETVVVSMKKIQVVELMQKC